MTFRVRALFVSLISLAASSAAPMTRYVDVNSTNPAPPYTNWASAARTIREAINVAGGGDLVLATYGVYSSGGGHRPIEGAGGAGAGGRICVQFY